MSAPSLSDLCVDGQTSAGVAEDKEVLLEWLDYFDSIIRKSLDAGEWAMDDMTWHDMIF